MKLFNTAKIKEGREIVECYSPQSMKRIIKKKRAISQPITLLAKVIHNYKRKLQPFKALMRIPKDKSKARHDMESYILGLLSTFNM